MSLDFLNAEALYANLRDTTESWRSNSTYWVGIASGGAWMAERLQRDWDLDKIGIISSSMHRDDYLSRGSKAATTRLEPTTLPFDVTGAHIVLLDDVLYTGRTIRAVMNELFDYGRPASVRLSVLVDRGGRELPLQADFSAQKIQINPSESLRLVRSDDGSFSFERK